MLQLTRCALLLSIYLASLGQAAELLVPITVNTSSISGTSGSIDLQFNPGPLVTQTADMMIVNFASNGTLVPGAQLTGGVSGALPGSLTFNNSTAYNDYFQDFTFGSTLSFTVVLYGPAVTSPNGTATSGSAFALSLFSDPAGTVPTLTTDTADGFTTVVNLNLNGGATVTNYSSQTTAGPVSTPEPGSFALLLAVFGLLGATRLVRARLVNVP
jgi:hypothetical protein